MIIRKTPMTKIDNFNTNADRGYRQAADYFYHVSEFNSRY